MYFYFILALVKILTFLKNYTFISIIRYTLNNMHNMAGFEKINELLIELPT